MDLNSNLTGCSSLIWDLFSLEPFIYAKKHSVWKSKCFLDDPLSNWSGNTRGQTWDRLSTVKIWDIPFQKPVRDNLISPVCAVGIIRGTYIASDWTIGWSVGIKAYGQIGKRLLGEVIEGQRQYSRSFPRHSPSPLPPSPHAFPEDSLPVAMLLNNR